MIDEWDPHRVDNIEATLVHYEDGATVCTIQPRQFAEQCTTTVWVSAEDGSFCALEEMR